MAVEAIDAYLADWNDGAKSRAVSDALIAALESAEQTEDVKYILENKEFLAKKSVWAIGGDGWAYDIGFGGIDHVMAQNRDVNLLVLDTEVYSNTGGQSSKATPTSATGQVRRRRQAGGQEGPGRHPDAVRLRVRGSGGHGLRPGPDPQGPAGGRGLSRPLPSSSATAPAWNSTSRPAWAALRTR